MHEVQTLVANISEMNMSIATASEQQTQVSDDIARRLTQIHDGSATAKEQSQSVSNSARQLLDIAAHLNREVKRFNL
ncbi:hypothetical protein ACFQMB_09355 [Pseudobowmanella zhangzhouensis]|uniref:hypothetical protein n=1 Tax=Pseudobowmanella zhangzhouensis TaxID=1537679 RepID=UPI003608D150